MDRLRLYFGQVSFLREDGVSRTNEQFAFLSRSDDEALGYVVRQATAKHPTRAIYGQNVFAVADELVRTAAANLPPAPGN